MKFRYYITDLFAGAILGTDSTEDANSYACSEDHFVVDTETGAWLTSDGAVQAIVAAAPPEWDADEEN